MTILSYIAEVRGGIAPQSGGRAVAFLQSRHLRGGRLSTEDMLWAARPARSAGRTRLVAGDVLVGARGAANPAVVVREMEFEVYPSLDLILIRPDPQQLVPEFLAAYINLPATQSALAGHRTTAVLPRLALGAIGLLPVPLPSLDRQRAVAALAAAARRETEILEALIDKRQDLLHELIRRASTNTLPDPCSAGHKAI